MAGQIQTVPRSELRILLDIIPRVQVPQTILCDCLGVVKGMQQLLRGGSGIPGRSPGPGGGARAGGRVGAGRIVY